MSKRPTNDDNKNIQLELMATEETKLALNVAETTRKHYKLQSAIIGKLYRQVNDHLNDKLSVSESKQIGDLVRNLGIWTAHFYENLSLLEQKESEAIIALGMEGKIDISNMTEEEIDAAIAQRMQRNRG